MRVTVSRTEDAAGGPLVDVGPPCVVAEDVLAHPVHLGAGVHIDIDLMARCHWRRLTFPPSSQDAHPILARLLGPRAADDVGGARAAPAPGDDPVPVDVAGAAPWLRIAVVDAVDRWLQLPLDQSLLDAERGVSRMRAAAGLPGGPSRSAVVGDALFLARRASRGVAGYLRGVAADGVVAPALRDALAGLVRGYAELSREVDGTDDALAAVVAAGQTLPDGREVVRHVVAPGRFPDGTPPGHGTSTIDPRQSRARTFAMSADPAVAEVSVASGGRVEPGTVAVRAAAFGAQVAPETLARLMVRLVERDSGRTAGHALLSRARRSGGQAFLQARVPLSGLDPAAVRADLFDVLVVGTPARDDTDAALRRARRAVTVLGGWRRLSALALMPVRPADIGPVLREAIEDLRGDGGPDAEPICSGGPSRQDLRESACREDAELLRWVRARGRGSAHDTGEPTVAELAAASAILAG